MKGIKMEYEFIRNGIIINSEKKIVKICAWKKIRRVHSVLNNKTKCTMYDIIYFVIYRLYNYSKYNQLYEL